MNFVLFASKLEIQKKVSASIWDTLLKYELPHQTGRFQGHQQKTWDRRNYVMLSAILKLRLSYSAENINFVLFPTKLEGFMAINKRHEMAETMLCFLQFSKRIWAILLKILTLFCSPANWKAWWPSTKDMRWAHRWENKNKNKKKQEKKTKQERNQPETWDGRTGEKKSFSCLLTAERRKLKKSPMSRNVFCPLWILYFDVWKLWNFVFYQNNRATPAQWLSKHSHLFD